MKFVTCFALGVLGVLSTSSYAQVSGRLTGSVQDPSGAPVVGAKVSLLLPGGTNAVITGETTSDGFFTLTGVRPETYELSIDATGFAKHVSKNVVVDAARETSLAPVKLDLTSVSTTVDVSTTGESVETANAEVSTTVTTEQIRRLPVINRSPVSLILTQPGVTSGRGSTVINGQRTSYSNVTLDGINIQDNFIRSNGLDFQPNLLLLDQVAEFTVSTSNTNSTVGGGASQVNFITPSGTNQFHGNAYWSNRNSALAANSWFNNSDRIKKSFLNQNQLGGSIGGHIIRDKLFFYSRIMHGN